MKNNFLKVLKKIWKYFVLPLIIIYFLGVFARLFYLEVYMKKVNLEVLRIHAKHISMDDVNGKNLPPDPGAEADKTLAGIDANENGIRDDVELAIFNAYPQSPKTRAVLLQYAFALQMQFTQKLISTETVTEIIREQSRGYICVASSVDDSDSKKFDKEVDFLTNLVKNKQINTEDRKNSRNNFLKKLDSFSELKQTCDIDISKLQ